MKKFILKYGLYSAALIIGLFSISFMTMDTIGMAAQEIFGYLSIFLALVFVFFGVKAYRVKERSGSIKFGRALGVGMLITLIPAIMFGLMDTIYVTIINPDFYAEYYAQMTIQYTQEFSGGELKAKLDELNGMKELASNPVFSFFLMVSTVLILGFIISLISALVLRKPEPAT